MRLTTPMTLLSSPRPWRTRTARSRQWPPLDPQARCGACRRGSRAL